MEYLDYAETPVVTLIHPTLDKAAVEVLVKREDLNHPLVSGNKWWKLKYNLLQARREGKTTLLTFGGAYSNHIYATAAAAHALGFESIGVIRGERTVPLNPTLDFATRHKMKLHYISRAAYRLKYGADTTDGLHALYGDFFTIPEGGTNSLAVRGTTEFASKLLGVDFDHVLLAVGTGGTIAGLIKAFGGHRQIIGVPVFKGGNYLEPEIERLVQISDGSRFSNWTLWTDYHHGGYAKTTPALLSFIREMYDTLHLPLDHIYTGKLLYSVFEEVKKGTFPRGTTLLALHTGGLQGTMTFK